MELYIIRHGETDYNLKGIVQGSKVDTDLNDTGRRQSEKFYEFYKEEKFDKIYTSNLKRAIQSVQKFIDMGIPWERDTALNEINWGNTDGQLATREQHSEYMETLRKWAVGDYSCRMPEGESPIDVADRQKPMVERLTSEKLDKVLVCMHGRAMRIFLCNLLKLDLREMDNFAHGNLCLYKLKRENGAFKIVLSNSSVHLL